MRYLLFGTLLQSKSMLRAPIAVLVAVLIPVLRSIVLVVLFSSSMQSPNPSFAILGAGLAGIWASVLFGAANLIQNERWLGTFDLLVSSPRSLSSLLIPAVCASAIVGLIGMLLTLGVGGLLLPEAVPFNSLPSVGLAVIFFALALISMSLVIGAVFVYFPNGNAIANALEYPVWILSGFVISIDGLPVGLQAIANTLPSTIATRLVHEAAMGSFSSVTAMSSLLASAIVGALGVALISMNERQAIRTGSIGRAA